MEEALNVSTPVKRLLVVAGDTLPLPGLPTTGAGLRAWGLGQGLASRGHEVTYLMPEASLRHAGAAPDLAVYHTIVYNHLDADALNYQLRELAPDVVVFQHWVSAISLSEKNLIPVVIDFHGPLLLETLYQDSPDFEALRQLKIRTLAKADFFTCAGEQQRHYFYPWLLLAGFDVRQDVIGVVPVSMPPEAPARMPAPTELTFVYGGVFLPWQDPTVALQTLVEVLEARKSGRLRIFGGAHTHIGIPLGKYHDLIPRLAASSRVELMGMIPRDALVDTYLRSHVAIDLMARNPERELAFTTRTVEYLWCGLPVIYNDYAELAGYIREYDAGWALDPLDDGAIRAVVESIIDDPSVLERKSQNARKLVHECLSWDRTIEPLDAFCRQPRKRMLTKQNRPLKVEALASVYKVEPRPPGRPKIVFVSSTPLGQTLIGPAIRCWELAQQVSRVADVTVTAHQAIDLPQSGVRLQPFATEDELLEIVKHNDVVVAQGPLTKIFPRLVECGKIMIYDLYDPLDLETLEQYRQESPALRDREFESTQTLLRDQMLTGDFFLCANDRQRDYWLGMLAGAGRLNPSTYDVGARDLCNLLTIVPMGVSCTPPQHTRNVLRGVHPAIGDGDIVLIWAGSLLDWLDPLTLIHAMKAVADKRDDVKLFFMASRHPVVQGVRISDQAIALSQELGLLDRTVIFNEEWIPYSARANYLLEADIGVTTHLSHLETHFSFRTRVLDYLWAARPIIASQGDAFGDLVEREGLGRAVRPGDVKALEQAILDLAADAALRDACSQRVKRVAQQFSWDRVAAPLVEFCREPRIAPDLWTTLPRRPIVQPPPEAAKSTVEIVDQLRAELHRTRRKPLTRTQAWAKATIKRLFRVEYIVDLFGRKVRLGSPLLAGQRLGRRFRAEATLLSGIELLTATFGRLNSCEVVLHIQDSPDASEDVATASVSALTMRDGAFCAFSFPPIVDSANRQFDFWVDSPDAVFGDCIALFLDAEDDGLVFRPRYG